MDENEQFDDYNPLSSSSDDSCSMFPENNCELDLNLSNIESETTHPITIKISPLFPLLNESSKQPIESEEIVPFQKKKRNKEDLNKTPLPLFDCIYCSNDTISFRHFSSMLISYNYLYGTSAFDITIMTKLISRHIVYSKFNSAIESMVIENTEYLNAYCRNEENQHFFQSDFFRNEVVAKEEQSLQYAFMRKVRGILLVSRRKHVQFIQTNSTNKVNALSCNNNPDDNNTNTNTNSKGATRNLLNVNGQNSTINNLSALIGDNYNNSSLNVNSLSLNYNNDIGNGNGNGNNNNPLKQVPESVSIVKTVEQENDHGDDDDYHEDFFNFLKFDIKRKVTKKDIQFEETAFDIWNPIFDVDEPAEKEAKPAKSERLSIMHISDNSSSTDIRPKRKLNERRTSIKELMSQEKKEHLSFLHDKGLASMDSPSMKSSSSIQSRIQELINDYNSNQNSKSSKLISTQCESKLSLTSPQSLLSFINYNSNTTRHHFSSIALFGSKATSQKNVHLERGKCFPQSIFESHNSSKHIRLANNSRVIESSFAKKKNEIIDLIHQDFSLQKRNRINVLPTTTPKRITKLTRTKVNAKSVLFTNQTTQSIHY